MYLSCQNFDNKSAIVIFIVIQLYIFFLLGISHGELLTCASNYLFIYVFPSTKFKEESANKSNLLPLYLIQLQTFHKLQVVVCLIG